MPWPSGRGGVLGLNDRRREWGVGLLSRNEKMPVATVEVALLDGDRARVTTWVAEADRQESAYHAVLHYMMYYGRLLFFLSYRPSAEELVGWMDEVIHTLAETDNDAPVHVARNWAIVTDSDEEPRAVWSSSLALVGPAQYKIIQKRPQDPQDADAQATALLHLQGLVDTLPALERAYLALGIAGMHGYYRDIKHWGNSKSLQPAPAHGIGYARRILEKRA